MSITSQRSVIVQWTGDIEYAQQFDAASVSTGSGQNQLVNLASGNNSITIPANAVAVTIIPPAANTTAIAAKAINADSNGLLLHLTDPTTIGLGSGATLVLNAAASLSGVRLIWS